MKKILLLTLTLVFLSGCKKANETAIAPPEPQPIEQASDILQNALTSGGSASCTISNATDGSVISYTMMGKKMKAEGISYANASSSGTMISDGSFMYMWDNATKKGMKIAVPTEEDLEKYKTQGQEIPDFSREDVQKDYENKGYTINCSKASVTDTDFVPPTDVVFTDMSQLMEQSKKMMNQYPTKNPPNQAEIDALIKQYQQ